MIIDPSSPVGKIRMRIGDWRDLPILDDLAIESAIVECNGDIRKASILCGRYILATLAFKSHQKLSMIEIWGRESYISYRDYLMLVIKDPDFSGISPIPYSSSGPSPITEFQKDWYNMYECGCNGGVNPL